MIKMHTGNNMVYSTIHPVFVRRVVEAIKEGGGKPFIADVSWDVFGAEKRGYSHEVIGCMSTTRLDQTKNIITAIITLTRTSRIGS